MRYGVFGAVVLVFGFGATEALSAQEPGETDAVKKVLEAWQKRRKAMKTVAYKVEGVDHYAKGSMTEDSPQAPPLLRKEYPPEDKSFPIRVEYMINFTEGKIRKERRFSILSVPLGGFRPKTSIQLFDGQKATLYEPRDENTSEVYTPVSSQPELRLYKNKGGRSFILMNEEYPILFAHGVPPAYNTGIDVTGYFDKTLDPSLFRYHERGTIGDRGCIIIRTVPEVGRGGAFNEFWVDLERDGAVLRWQAYRQGTATTRHEISYHLVDRNWLPQSWHFDRFATQNGHQLFIRGQQMNVVDIKIDPSFSSATFTVPQKQGMVVSDTQCGTFVIASDNRTLVPYGQSTHLWRWWHWIGVIAFSCAALWGIVNLVRRRFRRTS